MIKSIAYEYHWPPNVISEMFVDDYDFHGLVYWHDELVRIDKQMKKKSN